MSNVEKVQVLLKDGKLFGDVYSIGSDVVAVEISWGDWKHEHMRLRNLILGSDLNIVDYDCETTEENGSDTYSAIHKFSFAA